MQTLKELLLREPRWTLAVAESLTCGQLQASIGAISGASEFFAGGITAYSLEQKVRHLGVDRDLAASVNSVSAEVAEQMARGACDLFGTTLGVSTTGYAEPSPDHGVLHPFAWWGICHQHGNTSIVRTGRVECAGLPRVEVQRRVAETVLVQLLAYLKTARSV